MITIGNIPNTLVVFRNGSEERFLVDEIKEFVRDYINRNPINHEYLRQKQQLYREKQRTLVELEYRDNVDINLLHEHGHVLQGLGKVESIIRNNTERLSISIDVI